MTSANWRRGQAPGRPLEGPRTTLLLASSFLLHRDEGRLQVLAHLNHRDVAAVLAGP